VPARSIRLAKTAKAQRQIRKILRVKSVSQLLNELSRENQILCVWFPWSLVATASDEVFLSQNIPYFVA
jgi:hypothetical protein